MRLSRDPLDDRTVDTASCGEGSNGWPERVEPGHAEPSSVVEELLAHERDALNERVAGPVAARLQRAVEVVEHFEKRHEHRAPAALDVLREFLAQARARLIELVGGAAVLREQLLDLEVLLRDLRFQLFDVLRLELRLFGARPPRSPRAHQRRSVTFISDIEVRARRLAPFVSERQRAVGDADRDGAAVLELAEEDLVGQRIADVALDDARERPRAEDRVVALRWPATRAPPA